MSYTNGATSTIGGYNDLINLSTTELTRKIYKYPTIYFTTLQGLRKRDRSIASNYFRSSAGRVHITLRSYTLYEVDITRLFTYTYRGGSCF